MPAYSFKERFVPMVKDGTKPHTIRDRRKNPAKVGDDLYLYYGMRTKWCTRLGHEECQKTVSILISNDGHMFLFSGLVKDIEHTIALYLEKPFEFAGRTFEGIDGATITCYSLSLSQMQRLAWLDGFRPDGTTLENPKGSFDLMIRYWSATTKMPYCGDIIYWSLKYEAG